VSDIIEAAKDALASARHNLDAVESYLNDNRELEAELRALREENKELRGALGKIYGTNILDYIIPADYAERVVAIARTALSNQQSEEG
jgi:hypothetical protein